MKQTNANLDGLSRGSFLTPRSKTYLHLNSHTILHFVYNTSLTDPCFDKKFEQEKESLHKSISKSIYVDTHHIQILSPSTKFSSLNDKKVGGIAGVNYLKVKNDVTQ